MRKLWIPLLGIGGSVGMIQSVLWEFARMRPDYGFIVTPWSIRGYETVHGSVYAALGVVALISFLLVWWQGSQRTPISIAIVGLMVIGGTLIAAAFGEEPYVFTPGPPVVGGGGGLIGLAIFRLLKGQLRKDSWMSSYILRLAINVVVIGIVAAILNVTIGGEQQRLEVWVAVLAILAALGFLAVATEPRELAANRMLIYSTAVAALAMAMSAGAVRSTLIRFQAEEGGVAGAFIDTQVTSGHLMGVIAMLLVTVAAVMLWARRRDAIQTAARAARQRAAAEESAREIEEALRKSQQLQQQ